MTVPAYDEGTGEVLFNDTEKLPAFCPQINCCADINDTLTVLIQLEVATSGGNVIMHCAATTITRVSGTNRWEGTMSMPNCVDPNPFDVVFTCDDRDDEQSGGTEEDCLQIFGMTLNGNSLQDTDSCCCTDSDESLPGVGRGLACFVGGQGVLWDGARANPSTGCSGGTWDAADENNGSFPIVWVYDATSTEDPHCCVPQPCPDPILCPSNPCDELSLIDNEAEATDLWVAAARLVAELSEEGTAVDEWIAQLQGEIEGVYSGNASAEAFFEAARITEAAMSGNAVAAAAFVAQLRNDGVFTGNASAGGTFEAATAIIGLISGNVAASGSFVADVGCGSCGKCSGNSPATTSFRVNNATGSTTCCSSLLSARNLPCTTFGTNCFWNSGTIQCDSDITMVVEVSLRATNVQADIAFTKTGHSAFLLNYKFDLTAPVDCDAEYTLQYQSESGDTNSNPCTSNWNGTTFTWQPASSI